MFQQTAYVFFYDKILLRRLANVENELGVFFMNQAAALLDQVSADQGQVSVTAVAGARDLFNFSRKYLHQVRLICNLEKRNSKKQELLL